MNSDFVLELVVVKVEIISIQARIGFISEGGL